MVLTFLRNSFLIEIDADNTTKMFLDTINMLLDTYAPLKRINKYKLNSSLSLGKPWAYKSQYL